MDNTKYITVLILLLFIHALVNVMFSKIIFDWEPTLSKRIYLLAVLWLIPFLGIIFVYNSLNLNWFRDEDGSKGGGSVSTSFLEMDAIFNPGSKHVVEEQQREKMEVRKEGELYDNPESNLELEDKPRDKT